MKAISALLILAPVWSIVSGYTYRMSGHGIRTSLDQPWRAFSLLAASAAIIHFCAAAGLLLNSPYSPLPASTGIRRLANLGVVATVVLAIAIVLAAYAANYLEVSRTQSDNHNLWLAKFR